MLCAQFATRFRARHGQARRHGEDGAGRIFNLTSGQGLTPMPDSLPCAVTKAAVENLTVNLSVTLATAGITVNAVDPGPTDTGWMSPALYTRLAQQASMGRAGLPEDAARLVLSLASVQGSWITGQILRSRGGM